MELCNAIDTREISRDVSRVHRRANAREIGPHIALHFNAARQNMTLRVECQRSLGPTVAAMLIGNHATAAVVAPPDRPAEFLRRQEQWWVLRIGRSLHAERSADIIGEDMHLLTFHTHDIGKTTSQPKHSLARCMQSVAVCRRIEFSNRRARFHRRDMDSVVPQA